MIQTHTTLEHNLDVFQLYYLNMHFSSILGPGGWRTDLCKPLLILRSEVRLDGAADAECDGELSELLRCFDIW